MQAISDFLRIAKSSLIIILSQYYTENRIKWNRTGHALFKCRTPVEEWNHWGKYFISTADDGKTVRAEKVGSGTIFDTIEAALFSYKNAGLSQPHCCAGAIGQFLRKLELPNPFSRSL